MSTNINQSMKPLQGQFADIEQFALFRFSHRLGKGIKSRIKSYGCHWSSLHQGWLCPIAKQAEVKHSVQDAKINYTIQIQPLPKGIIPSDPKIAGKQSRLDLLEEQFYHQDRLLLQEICLYNPTMRPEDFAKPLTDEGKTLTQIRIENDFHARWVVLQKKKQKSNKQGVN